jgi:outer membrane protein assembly factor BamB
VVIDLGEERAPPRLDRPAVLSVRARCALAQPPPLKRLHAATIALAATLLLAAGSAPPTPSDVVETRIPAALGDAMEMVGDRLYVIRPEPSFPDTRVRTVTAYHLPGAQLLWQTPLPVHGTVRNTLVGAAVLLISVQVDSAVQTVALDTGSGRVRWLRPSIVLGLAAGGRLVVTAGETPGPAPVPQLVVAVDMLTGEPAWSYEVPIDGWHYLDYDVPQAANAGDVAGGRPAGGSGDSPDGSGQEPVAIRSVVAQPTGHVVVRDLETGRVTAAADLGPRTATSYSSIPVFQVAGDLLLADWTSDGWRIVSAYGLATLDLRWRQELGLATDYVSADCGGQLCVFARSGGLRVLDRGTGETRWSDRRWALAETLAGRLLVHAWQLPGPGSLSAVVDPLTGRVLLDLGRWITMRSASSGGVGGLPAARLDSATARAWFGTVDLASLTIRVLGSAPDVSGDCRSGASWVVCRRLDASIGVWTYRS